MTMTSERRKKRPFTLFEIALCVVILGLIGTLLGWQIKTMVARHHFHKNLDMLVTDLQKIQIMALANRCDIELKILQKNGTISYQVSSDEKLPQINGKEVKLLGVKKVKTPHTLTVYASGRIVPQEEILFFQDEGETMGAKLIPSSKIELKFLQPSD